MVVVLPLLLHLKQHKCLTKQTLILEISKTQGNIFSEILRKLKYNHFE